MNFIKSNLSKQTTVQKNTEIPRKDKEDTNKHQLKVKKITFPYIKSSHSRQMNINTTKQLKNQKINLIPSSSSSSILLILTSKAVCLLEIFQYLRIEELYKCILINKKIYNLILNSDEIWYNHYISLLQSKTKCELMNQELKYYNEVRKLILKKKVDAVEFIKKGFSNIISKFKYDFINNPYFVSSHLFSKIELCNYINVDFNDYSKNKHQLINGNLKKISYKLNPVLTYMHSGVNTSDYSKKKDISSKFFVSSSSQICFFLYSDLSSDNCNNKISIKNLEKISISHEILHKNKVVTNLKNIYSSILNTKTIVKVINNNSNKIYSVYYIKSSFLYIITFKEYKSSNEIIIMMYLSLPKCRTIELLNINLFKIPLLYSINHENICFDNRLSQYDCSCLIIIKSLKNIYFNIPLRKLDFQKNESSFSFCVDLSSHPIREKPLFSIEYNGIYEEYDNLLILDICLMNNHGSHIICNSLPMIIKQVDSKEDFIQYELEDINSKIYICEIESIGSYKIEFLFLERQSSEYKFFIKNFGIKIF